MGEVYRAHDCELERDVAIKTLPPELTRARGRITPQLIRVALRLSLDQALLVAKTRGVELLALDEALVALARLDCRKSRVVELRYFGGLNIDDVAEVLEVSVDTVKRDWRMARAWLLAELTDAGSAHGRET